MIGWFEVRLADPPDWISPYFVHELRVLLRLAQFGIPLIVLMAVSWFLAFRGLLDISFQDRSNSFRAMQMLLTFYLAGLTPSIVLSGFQTRHDPERDLIRLVPRSGLELVTGKLWAAGAVNLLYSLATLPFFATASILLGGSFAGSIGRIVCTVCVGFAQAELAILCGLVSNRFFRILGLAVLVTSSFVWIIGIELLNEHRGIEVVLVGLAFQGTFLLFAHGIVVAQLQQMGPYLLPVPYEPDWARLVARVAQRLVTAIHAVEEVSRGTSEVDTETEAEWERALRTAAQQLARVLNPGTNTWTGLGCRCALSRSLKPAADEVAFAAQQVFERLGCLEPLLFGKMLQTPLWTDVPPVIPTEEMGRLQSAIDQLQAWSDRHMPRS